MPRDSIEPGPFRPSSNPPQSGMMQIPMSDHSSTLLVRYGAIPEVARFANPQAIPLDRGTAVVVTTHRGPELGAVLEELRPSAEPRIDSTPLPDPSGEV